MHHAGIAFLAVLVTPVGIVVAVVGQPVGFLGRGTLLGAFGGRAEGHDIDGVAVVDAFLGGEEVGERVVERSLDYAFVSPAVADLSGKGPAALQPAGTEREHGACLVVAVAAREGDFAALGIGGSPQVGILTAAYGSHAEVVVLEHRDAFPVAGHIVQTANHGIGERAAHHVVHQNTVQVVLLIEVVVSAYFETHGRETEAHFREEEVVVARRDARHNLGGIGIFIQLRFREREIRHLVDSLCFSHRKGVGFLRRCCQHHAAQHH